MGTEHECLLSQPADVIFIGSVHEFAIICAHCHCHWLDMMPTINHQYELSRYISNLFIIPYLSNNYSNFIVNYGIQNGQIFF
jgi:hypothetical protein